MAGANRALVALCVIGVALGAPAGASAASVRVDGGHFTYEALPGEANHPAQLHYDPAADRWTLLELPLFPIPGPGCEADPNPSIVYCEGSDEPLNATIEMGDSDDWYQQGDIVTYDNQTGVTTEIPVEEPFSQTVDAGPGNDNFWANATGSPTTFQGGPGDDRFIFFTARPSTPPTPPNTYRLGGGEGSDTMEVPWGMPPLPPPPGGVGLTMDGGPDADVIRGSKGNDLIDGGEGSDDLWDLPGDDAVGGGGGADQLYGGEGDDVQNGGEGDDWILVFNGSDRIDGGPGDDWINSKNLGHADEVRCGEGNDEILPDAGLDLIATDCERIVIPETCEGPRACTDTITVTTAGRPLAARSRIGRPARRLILGRTRFKLRGHSRSGKLPLSATGRAYIERRGVVRAVRTTRIVKPRGKRPPKVTIKRIALLLRAP